MISPNRWLSTPLFQRHDRFTARRFCIGLGVLLSCFQPISVCHAQNPIDTGILPFHVYQNGNIDHVNLDTLGLTVSIPLVSYPQRGNGLTMSFALVFSSPQNFGPTNCFVASEPGSSQRVRECNTTWSVPSLVGGSTLLPSPINSYYGVKLVDTQEVDEAQISLPVDVGGTTYHTTQVVWLTADGGAHPAGPITSPAGQIAMDGSGYQNGTTYSLSATSTYGTPTCNWLCAEPGMIATKDGVTYFGVGTGPSTSTGNILREDADGNYITRSSTEYVDTAGRTIPLPTLVANPTAAQIESCGGPLPVTSIATWTPPGYSEPFLFCYANVTITLPWATAFVPGTSSYGVTSTTAPELQSVVLPNQQVWTFQYGESLTTYQTPGGAVANSGINTGDITQITFPTGGTLSYQYDLVSTAAYPVSGTQNKTYVTSRSLNANDGTGSHAWSYAFTSGYDQTTTTDPVGNKTVETVTPNVSGQGNATRTTATSDSSGKVWQTVTTTYPAQYASPKGFPLYPSTVVTALDDGQSTETTYTYCCNIPVIYTLASATPAGGEYYWAVSNGKVTDEKVYDYTSGSQGTLLRDTQTAYEFQSNTNYSSESSFFDLPAKVSIYSGGEALLSQTSYAYDGSSTVSGGISTQLSTPLFSVLGHLTSQTNYLNTGGSSPVTTNTYYNTGELYQTTDPRGYTTTYNYSSTYAGSLPTSVKNALGQTTTTSYVEATGQVSSIIDPNSATTSYTYNDPMTRLTNISYPDGGSASFAYHDTGTLGVTVTQAVGTSVNMVTQENVDGVGRLYETETTSDPAGTVYTRTSYDGDGRTYQVWNPSRCNPMSVTSCASEPTWGKTTYGYDALNRVTSQTDADGVNTQKWAFTNNDTTYTDESGNEWLRITDALGRLTEVLEPNGTSQTPSMETSYSYDALGNLLSVAQCGAPCGSPPSNDVARSFSYDSLSRLLTATNPESGAVSYTYDGDGNVVTKTSPLVNAASGTQTLGYCYDALDRVTYKFYSAPPSPCTSPSGYTESYAYDASSISGNAKVVGRLTDEKAYISGTLVSETSPYVYDAMGRIQKEQQCPFSPCATPYTLSYTYNYAGDVATATNGLSQAAAALGFTFTYDGSDHLQEVQATLQPSTWSTTTYPPVLLLANGTSPAAYDPLGNLIHAGNGLVSTTATAAFATSRAFDPRGRVTAMSNGSLYTFSVPSGGYAANSNLTSLADSVTGSWAFQYDTLNRLTTATASAGVYNGQNGCWTYDAFGNRKLEAFSTTTTTPCAAGEPAGSQYTVTTPSGSYNNRVSGFTYDGAGDVLSDGQNSYAYDTEGRLCAVSYPNGVGGDSIERYLYNAEGQRVGKGSGSSLTCSAPTSANGFSLSNQYLLGLDGEQVTELNGSGAAVHSNVYDAAGLMASYNFASGGLHFALTDPLGTKRVQVSGTGAAELNCISLPFGNNIGNSRTSDCVPVGSGAPDATEHHFTGKERDTESGNDYFGARYYGSSVGRFLSADPLGPWVADAGNPQTWNMYTYGLNNPLIYTDPNGYDCVYFNDAGDGIESIDREDSPQNSGTSLEQQSSDCGANGGDWINGRVTGASYFGDSDTFGFTSSDASNSYLTYANAPGTEIGGTICSGNCDTANGYSQTALDNSWGAQPIAPSSQQFVQQVAKQTGPILKAGDCAAAGAFAFSPVVTPEDAKDVSEALTDQGMDAAEKGLESLSEAEKLAKGITTSAKVGSKVLNGAGKVMAIHGAYKNMKEAGCFGGGHHE